MVKGVIIFTGPSLHPDVAKKILDANYQPPVGRGDILKALNDKPVIIGIIDGVFHQKPAVSHKEILKALNQGIKMVGGSSMGALRASELDEWGMIGVGKVYEAYKSGEIESDDDVAVVFDPETYEQLSEALVSMNYNFKRACEEGVISPEELKILYETAKSIYYPKRTYIRVLNDSNISSNKKSMIMEFLENKGKDIKREDALMVLKFIKTLFESI